MTARSPHAEQDDPPVLSVSLGDTGIFRVGGKTRKSPTEKYGAQKEAIATLLVNLPIFARNAAKGKWPVWLSKKSYFKEGLHFFEVYREAVGGPAVKALALETPRSRKGQNKSPRSRKRSGKSSRTPAFAKGTKGGVFGLKRK